MGKQSATDSLKESIRLLEIRQAEEGKILKEQFKITYDSLKPVNIIKSTIRELVNSSEVKNNLFETLLALISGHFAKSIVSGGKGNLFMKVMRALAHFGLTNLVINNVEEIRLYISNWISKLFSPKEKVVETEA